MVYSVAIIAPHRPNYYDNMYDSNLLDKNIGNWCCLGQPIPPFLEQDFSSDISKSSIELCIGGGGE